jgi:hypothetical protein
MTRNTKSLIQKIHEILDGKADAPAAERVAQDYLQLCEQVNQRVKAFCRLIREGRYYAALDLESVPPSLSKQVELLRFPREAEWRNWLQRNQLPIYDGFNDQDLRTVREGCSDPIRQSPTGYRAYRKAMLTRDLPAAMRALRQLLSEHPRDQNARHELARVEQQVFASMEAELAKLLQQGPEATLFEKVRELTAQPWVQEPDSEIWKNCKQRLDAHLRKKEREQLQLCLRQLKVIQRVGYWKDGLPLIGLLKPLIEETKLADTTEQEEARNLIAWFEQQGGNSRRKENAEELLQDLIHRMEANAIDAVLDMRSKRKRRTYEDQLIHDWTEVEACLPGPSIVVRPMFDRALERLNPPRKPLNLPILRWLRNLSLAAALAGALYFGNRSLQNHYQDETRLAQSISSAHLEKQWDTTVELLEQWNRLKKDRFSRFNPLRNRSAHQQVDAIQSAMTGLRLRERQAMELLASVETSLLLPPDRSTLESMQARLRKAESLLEPVFAAGSHTADETLRMLQERVGAVGNYQLSDLPTEIRKQLDLLETRLTATLSWDHADMADASLSANQAKELLESFHRDYAVVLASPDYLELQPRYEKAKASLPAYQDAIRERTSLLKKMAESQSAQEYLDHLNRLAASPFRNNSSVIAAKNINTQDPALRNLAQHLLLPDNPNAWDQFQKNLDRPFYPDTPNPKEKQIMEQLLGNEGLGNIYRYRTETYQNGSRLPGIQTFFGRGEAKMFEESVGTLGRSVQTVMAFDPSKVGLGGEPFSERIATCSLDASGNPLDGERLVLEQLSSESALYRQLPRLTGYDPASGQIFGPLLDVIDSIKEDGLTSTVFRAYLTQELMKVVVTRPYEWGLHFAPTLQIEYKRLMPIKGDLFPYDWMRDSVRERLEAPLQSYFDELSDLLYIEQAMASRELFAQLSKQRIRYAGYAMPDGAFLLQPNTPSDRRLYGIGVDGVIQVLRASSTDLEPPPLEAPAPLTPLLFFNDPPQAILDRVSRQTGVEVRSWTFRPYLPDVFQ